MPTIEIGLGLAFVAFLGIIYPHLLYPLVLRVIHRFSADPVRRLHATHGNVDVVIAAYNEEERIERCLESVVHQTYSGGAVRILVGDDGSSDGTIDRIREFAAQHPGRSIEVVALSRSGKNGVLRTLVQRATADVVVFTDADCIWAPEALDELLAPFHDDRVGAVVGKNDRGALRQAHDPAERGEALYRSMEDRVNVFESDVASTVASNGALYAVRRTLLDPIPDGRVADDWFNVLCSVAKGRRVVFAADARVVEDRANSLAMEYARTIRTVSSGISALLAKPQLLLPTSGWFSFFLFSHRVVRWLSPFFVLMMIPATALTVSDPMIFGILFYGQVLVYALALLGRAAARYGQHVPLASTCLFFVAMNASFLIGILKLIGRGSMDQWTPSETQG